MKPSRPTKTAKLPQPTVLGLKPSFGFGDRLGLATPGHIAACRKGRLAPIFAQQSVRELARTNRTPEEVMECARQAIQQEGWTDPWGADGDHLKTREDVARLAKAGFTFFTIDPSAHVNNEADRLKGAALEKALGEVLGTGAFESVKELESHYLHKKFEVPGFKDHFADQETLYRAAIKYGRAVAYSQKMAGWIATATRDRSSEIELSVDETESPTSPLEHLFVAAEMKRRKIRAVSVALRFVGDFEKGIDYKGDIARFESDLRLHVAISRFFGPYKIGVHSGSDKFSIYPVIGRVCGDLLHVKTAGTSYLEAIRVIARKNVPLFREIACYALNRYEEDRKSYHVSARAAEVKSPAHLADSELEGEFLNQEAGRQVIHVTFGSVLTVAKDSKGLPFKEGILNTLRKESDLYREVLIQHIGRHVTLLTAG